MERELWSVSVGEQQSARETRQQTEEKDIAVSPPIPVQEKLRESPEDPHSTEVLWEGWPGEAAMPWQMENVSKLL